MLDGKRVILGVTGSIAAYKSAFLVRELVKSGAAVKVVMTDAAKSFIAPLTLSTLSGNPVLSGFFDESTGQWSDHVDLGRWADIMIIAPASAHTLSRMANGICNDMLMATYLSAECSVCFAPAMDLEMYRHPSTQGNVEKLMANGDELIPPEEGELASGAHGIGRMAEPEKIIEYVDRGDHLNGKKVLVTAGPTYEAIDPVRYIGNHSSGKMGFAIAEIAAKRGAEVTLVAGPTSMKVQHPSIKRIDIVSAEEMYEAVHKAFPTSDITIMSAAVADQRPKKTSDKKLKKREGGNKSIELESTPDILSSLGAARSKGQLLVGFALETNDEKANALKKLKEKGLDLIVLNSLSDDGAGFGHDTNKVTFITADNKEDTLPLLHKREVAVHLVDKVIPSLAE